ncbi:MAG: hypothetical protein QOG42_1885 [Solirubrobacteraceae bacterium]|nr:hypothetical protein [Solirubrobacteraceae bacterium]
MRRALIASVLTGLSGQAAIMVSGVVAARMLGVEHRGELALLLVLPLLLTQFGGLGLPLATTFEIAREPKIARPLLRGLRGFVGLQTILLTLVHGVILVLLMRGRDNDVQLAAASTIVIVPSYVALAHGLAVMQGQERYTEFNVLRLAPAILYAAVALGLFASGSGTLPLLTGSAAAGWLVIGVLTLVLAIRGSQRGVPDAALPSTAHLVRFGARSMLGSVSPSDGAGIDQVVIGLFLSTRALGLYVVAAAFMNLSRLVTQSIGLVAYPQVAARRDPEAAERAMWRFTATGVAAAAAIVVVLELVVDRLIVFFFGDSFAPAAGVARVLLVAALFMGARRVLSDAARGANRPLAGTVAEIASWVVLVPSMIVLTPLFDLHGVAWALVLASAAGLWVILWRVRRPLGPQPPAPPRYPAAPVDVVADSRDVL